MKARVVQPGRGASLLPRVDHRGEPSLAVVLMTHRSAWKGVHGMLRPVALPLSGGEERRTRIGSLYKCARS